MFWHLLIEFDCRLSLMSSLMSTVIWYESKGVEIEEVAEPAPESRQFACRALPEDAATVSIIPFDWHCSCFCKFVTLFFVETCTQGPLLEGLRGG